MKNLNTFIAENNLPKFKYVTKFNLEVPVKIDDANYYLHEADMIEFLKDNIEDHPDKTTIKPDDLVSITWTMDRSYTNHSDHGTITLITTRELTTKELDFVSKYVSGQNSDGLGEGFEQNFPNDTEEDEDGYGDDAMASFDWKTNDYKFTKK